MGQPVDAPKLVLAVGYREHLDVSWPLGDRVNDPLELAVTFVEAHSGQRAKARFTLRRKGSSPNGEPLWRQQETSVERL